MGLKQLARQGFQAGIRADQVLAGIIGLHGISWDNRLTSVGYWLGGTFLRRGLMIRALAGVVGIAFAEYQLNRIEMRAATGNQRSRAVPERLGFHYEGTVRQAEWLYDHYVDQPSIPCTIRWRTLQAPHRNCPKSWDAFTQNSPNAHSQG